MNSDPLDNDAEDLASAFLKAGLPEQLTFDALMAAPRRILENGEEALSHIIRKDFLTAAGLRHLHEQGIALHAVNNRSSTPLFDAICDDNHDLFNALMDNGGDAAVNSMQELRADRRSLLHAVVMRGHLQMAERLIGAGADVNAIDQDLHSPLARAVATCDENMIRLLLRAGADVAKYEAHTQIKLLHLMHPMIQAAACGGPEDRIVTMLIDQGANTDAENAHGVPLVAHYAERNRVDIIAAMARAGANMDAAGPGTNHFTALTHAVIHGNAEMIAILLGAGADPNATTAYADLPLMYALRKDNRDICDQLIAGGASPNGQRQNGLSLLCESVLGNISLSTVEYLLDMGADPNLISFSGDGRARPLHIATNQQRIDCIEMLLNYGANPLLPDLTGTLPLEYAMKRLGPGHGVTERLRKASLDAASGRDAGITIIRKHKPPQGGTQP